MVSFNYPLLLPPVPPATIPPQWEMQYHYHHYNFFRLQLQLATSLCQKSWFTFSRLENKKINGCNTLLTASSISSSKPQSNPAENVMVVEPQ